MKGASPATNPSIGEDLAQKVMFHWTLFRQPEGQIAFFTKKQQQDTPAKRLVGDVIGVEFVRVLNTLRPCRVGRCSGVSVGQRHVRPGEDGSQLLSSCAAGSFHTRGWEESCRKATTHDFSKAWVTFQVFGLYSIYIDKCSCCC